MNFEKYHKFIKIGRLRVKDSTKTIQPSDFDRVFLL